jgi:putative oxidoreductase
MGNEMLLISRLKGLHDAVFDWIERTFGGWLPGLAARFVFAAVLFFYFHNSWSTKVGAGFPGFLIVQDNAYYQIVPTAVDAVGGEIGKLSLLDHLVVYAGTYAELLLPILIVLGLFTRLAAIGMMGFIAVQTYVDIYALKVGPETVGAWFDNQSGSVIADQRTLWIFLLLTLVLKGSGALSLDGLLSRLWGSRR